MRVNIIHEWGNWGAWWANGSRTWPSFRPWTCLSAGCVGWWEPYIHTPWGNWPPQKEACSPKVIPHPMTSWCWSTKAQAPCLDLCHLWRAISVSDFLVAHGSELLPLLKLPSLTPPQWLFIKAFLNQLPAAQSLSQSYSPRDPRTLCSLSFFCPPIFPLSFLLLFIPYFPNA